MPHYPGRHCEDKTTPHRSHVHVIDGVGYGCGGIDYNHGTTDGEYTACGRQRDLFHRVSPGPITCPACMTALQARSVDVTVSTRRRTMAPGNLVARARGAAKLGVPTDRTTARIVSQAPGKVTFRVTATD